MKNRFHNILVHVADFGFVAYVAIAILALIVVIGELVRPGIAVNYISPQRLLAAGVLAGALSVVVSEKKRGNLARAGYWLTAVVMTILTYHGTLQYFIGLPDVALRLSVVASVTVFSAFLLFDSSS